MAGQLCIFYKVSVISRQSSMSSLGMVPFVLGCFLCWLPGNSSAAAAQLHGWVRAGRYIYIEKHLSRVVVETCGKVLQEEDSNACQ